MAFQILSSHIHLFFYLYFSYAFLCPLELKNRWKCFSPLTKCITRKTTQNQDHLASQGFLQSGVFRTSEGNHQGHSAHSLQDLSSLQHSECIFSLKPDSWALRCVIYFVSHERMTPVFLIIFLQHICCMTFLSIYVIIDKTIYVSLEQLFFLI